MFTNNFNKKPINSNDQQSEFNEDFKEFCVKFECCFVIN